MPQRAIATELPPKQANGFQHDPTTRAVRPTRPLTG